MTTPSNGSPANILRGRTLLIPRMSDEGAATFAAAFRSIGVDTAPVPPSNARAMELAGRFTSGDECYPEQVTLGSFLRAIEDFGPSKVALFLPTASGPCRFGQYLPYLRKVLREIGHEDVPVVSPTSNNSYEGVGEQQGGLVRTAWRALVAADILRKLCLRIRPYEVASGDTDQAVQECLDDICSVIQRQGVGHGHQMDALVESMERTGRRFASIHTKAAERPLVGVVGEIFCRLSTFSNEDVVRKIEAHGGECWISDIAEWIWYTNEEEAIRLSRQGGLLSAGLIKSKIKMIFQRRDEHKLLRPVMPLLKGREEPERIVEVLERSAPYLPHTGALGEMVLSVGKAVYLYEKGASGIADISPFTCMNGIICESIYPRVSREHDGIPIRNFYFDGTQKTVEQDVGIFMELVRNYYRRAIASGSGGTAVRRLAVAGA